MLKVIEAFFDGKSIVPTEPVDLEPNTRVRITVEPVAEEKPPEGSFLRTAQSLNLEGPSDWAANLHEYLYGEDRVGEQ
jgi:hypothetical protein